MPAPQLIDRGPALTRSGLIHRLRQPDAPAPLPTVVMLHGRAGDEDAMWVFARTVPAAWLIVAPRGILPDEQGFGWVDYTPGAWPSLGDFDEAVAVVRRFLLTLPALYGADPDRLYLMGFSQGAALSYALAMGYPGLVQGIAGLVGFVPTECEPAIETAALRDLPIFMGVGREDPRIPYEQARRCAETLRAVGADLTLREYDAGHHLPAQGMRDLRAWWLARPAPP